VFLIVLILIIIVLIVLSVHTVYIYFCTRTPVSASEPRCSLSQCMLYDYCLTYYLYMCTLIIDIIDSIQFEYIACRWFDYAHRYYSQHKQISLDTTPYLSSLSWLPSGEGELRSCAPQFTFCELL